tara:strand:- start:11 stop:196 length:186 start_codon:yes stop_codon:yes gene_type:complete
MLSPFDASTANFLLPPGVLFGLLKPENDSPLYVTLPEGVRDACDFVAITSLLFSLLLYEQL